MKSVPELQSPEYFENPYPTLAALRDPVARLHGPMLNFRQFKALPVVY